MPVSGLVVSLLCDPQLRAATLAEIGRQPEITMGVLDANQLAIVVDTDSSQEDRRLWEWLSALSGVSLLEVAFVGFEQHAELTPFDAGQVPSATPDDPTAVRKEELHDGC